MALKKPDNLTTSGVSGLDDLLGGGFVRGNSILLCGQPGTGKTTLGFQFLISGAKIPEPGAYISFDEDEKKLLSHMVSFDWQLEELRTKDLLRLQKVGALEIQQFASQESILLIEIIRSINAKRVVVDSLTSYELLFKEDYERMLYVKRLVDEIVHRDCTFLATSEAPPGKLSRFGISEFIFDTIISLELNPDSKTGRTLEVIKNRGNPHKLGKYQMEITSSGVEVRQK
jgi:circadian clock protein KaiC